LPSQSPDNPLYRAVVADDHAILRNSICDILAQHGGFAEPIEAQDGLEAIATVRAKRPDLLSLDVAMPFAQGIGVYLEARRWSPDTKIIVFTGMTSRTILGELVRAGVDGLFLKSGDPQHLINAIPLVMNGGRVISPDVVDLLEDTPENGLTEREQQILGFVATGNTNREIAETLGISFKTVDHHRTNLMRKLGVHSTAELLGYAFREGYLDHSRET